MKIGNWLIVGMLAASLVACDPYDKSKSANAVVGVLTVTDGGTPTDGAASGGAWSVTDVDCTAPGFVQIITNGRLNGAAIQQTPGDCRPTAGWLNVTPAAPAGSAYYACYMPSSPADFEGGSIVVYIAPFSEDDPATADVDETFYSVGWIDAEPIPAPGISIAAATVGGFAVPSVTVACAP